MLRTYNALRPMGLLAVLLGIMIFGGTMAQAEPGAHWNVNGSPISGSLEVEGEGEFESNAVLLANVGIAKIELSCTAIKALHLVMEESGSGSGKIHFEKCTTKINGSTASRCTPKSPGAEAGLVESNALDGLIELHELSPGNQIDLVQLLPTEGTTFLTVELGALCAIGNKFNITGKASLKDCQEEGLVEKIKHLVEEGPLSALLFGGNAATIDGSAIVFLAAKHAGLTFSGHPA